MLLIYFVLLAFLIFKHQGSVFFADISLGELIIYPCSGVRTCCRRRSRCCCRRRSPFSNIISSETARPIKAKFLVEPNWEGLRYFISALPRPSKVTVLHENNKGYHFSTFLAICWQCLEKPICMWKTAVLCFSGFEEAQQTSTEAWQE